MGIPSAGNIAAPLRITLEFTRAAAAEDPYAFALGAQSYLLREAGGVYKGFEITWDEALRADLAALSCPDPSPEIAARMGERLRRILTLAGWERHDEAITEAAGQGRQVLLDVLSAAAELYSLPWELVPLRSSGAAIHEVPQLLIRYAWPATRSTPADAAPEGGRILFAWSSAGGPVPWREHEEILRGAVASAGALSALVLDVVAEVTPASLAEALSRQPAVVHLLCHGSGGERGGLVLSGAQDGVDLDDVVGPARLRQILAPAVSSLRLLVLCACGSGASNGVASPLGSLALAAHRLGVPSIIAFRTPVSTMGATAAARALYGDLFHKLRSLENATLAARTALLGSPSQDGAALLLLSRAEDGEDTRPVAFRPYRGLLAFGPEQTRFFFGRDEELREILSELDQLQAEARPRFQVVEGASGTGKSSLVLAGVVPVLEARGWTWTRMVPGTDPLSALDRALALRRPESAPFLLIVDQLEEIFTQGADGAEGRAAADSLVRRLWALASEATPVHVICTLRTDFRGRCGEVHLDARLPMDQLFRPEMASHHVFVVQMGPEQLREVISRPAALVGLALPSDLVDRALLAASPAPSVEEAESNPISRLSGKAARIAVGSKTWVVLEEVVKVILMSPRIAVPPKSSQGPGRSRKVPPPERVSRLKSEAARSTDST